MTFLEKLKDIVKYKRLQRYIGWVHCGYIFDNIKNGFPVSIEPRNAHEIFILEERIREMLSASKVNTFAAVVQDALWRDKYSPIFRM